MSVLGKSVMLEILPWPVVCRRDRIIEILPLFEMGGVPADAVRRSWLCSVCDHTWGHCSCEIRICEAQVPEKAGYQLDG